MIQSANCYKLAALFNPDEKIRYEIPKYQREYVWGKQEWDNLYEDLYENQDHFLGSMICINKGKDALEINPLEVIDGQQRLLTISILYLVMYVRLSEEKGKDPGDENLLVTTINLKHRLLQKSDGGKSLKVVPSYQSKNYQDYCALLHETGVFQTKHEKPANAGLRRIIKAYRFYQNRLKDESKEALFALLERINSASIVKIEVGSHADAFTLFESLNNRGVPLSPMDIIKNKMLAELEQNNIMSIDDAFSRWNNLITAIPEYRDQERFLRQYYNAFRYKEGVHFQGISKATRSKLITIYETFIKKDPSKALLELEEKANTYGRYTVSFESLNSDPLMKNLFDLQNVGGAPGYILLLYLMSEHGEKKDQIQSISEFLVKYFIRRNITDYPATRDLDKIFMDAVDSLEKNKNSQITSTVKKFLVDPRRFASDDLFREMLSGDIYDNPDATRFVLTKIEESSFTKEKEFNFWKKEKNTLVWTIEHIFPKGENIPDSWVQSIAGGNREGAKELQYKWVHKLGNLTLTAYNQYLSTFSFEKKRDRKDAKGNYIGYKNGLFLNKELAEMENWTTVDIQKRTNDLVEQAMQLFKV